MRSRLPDSTEHELRRICAAYPENKELIEDALSEALSKSHREEMLKDIANRTGYYNSKLSVFMSDKIYREHKYRVKLCLAKRFNLPIERSAI